MTKWPKDLPNPFEYRDELQKVEKQNAKQQQLKDRIQEIIKGDKPENPMSWEFYIWRTHNDPLRVK
jgi:hypothetical protein